MPVSGKESILDGIFSVCCVPQEPESPLVKHRQVARHNAVQFLSTLPKDTRANFLLLFNERCYRRHNVYPLQATLGSEDYSLPTARLGSVASRSHATTASAGRVGSDFFACE